MNTHVKSPRRNSADLSRRSFLVGTAAAGLALGYSAVPSLLGADQALAAPANFDPSVWYSIAPDGLVTVTCGKADMGQHIASTMAQIISEELGSTGRTCGPAASNDPKFNDPVLGRPDHRRQLVDDDELRRDEPRGRRGANRVDGGGGHLDGRARRRTGRARLRVSHPKSKKSMTFADIVKSGKTTKTFTPDELKAIKLKTPISTP